MSKNFISFNIMGGLGNILFPAATAYSYSIDNNYDFKTNNGHSGYLHTNPKHYLDSIFKNFETLSEIPSVVVHEENSFTFKQIPTHEGLDIFLSGYYQSEKYFAKNENKINSLILSDFDRFGLANDKFNALFNCDDTVVSLHVRRGSYLKLKDHHTNLSLEYYKKALSLVDHTKVLIFSDEIEYCRENFIDKKYFFHYSEDDLLDLYLMSLCHNNIIANSTYSWWGAWLNKNKNKKIIAPKKWFGPSNSHFDTKDLIPESWIKI
jgi:hypothetical protein